MDTDVLPHNHLNQLISQYIFGRFSWFFYDYDRSWLLRVIFRLNSTFLLTTLKFMFNDIRCSIRHMMFLSKNCFFLNFKDALLLVQQLKPSWKTSPNLFLSSSVRYFSISERDVRLDVLKTDLRGISKRLSRSIQSSPIKLYSEFSTR